MSNNVKCSKVRSRRVRLKTKNFSRLRISVFRSNRHFYVQIIDDKTSSTLLCASSLELRNKESDNLLHSNYNVNSGVVTKVAELIVGKFKDSIGFSRKCVFDRGSYPYQGNVKLFSECLRKAGLEF